MFMSVYVCIYIHTYMRVQVSESTRVVQMRWRGYTLLLLPLLSLR